MKQLDTTYYATNVKDQMMTLMANEELNGLNEHEVYGTMLAAAIATDNPTVAHNMECFVKEYIDEETIANAKFTDYCYRRNGSLAKQTSPFPEGAHQGNN